MDGSRVSASCTCRRASGSGRLPPPPPPSPLHSAATDGCSGLYGRNLTVNYNHIDYMDRLGNVRRGRNIIKNTKGCFLRSLRYFLPFQASLEYRRLDCKIDVKSTLRKRGAGGDFRDNLDRPPHKQPHSSRIDDQREILVGCSGRILKYLGRVVKVDGKIRNPRTSRGYIQSRCRSPAASSFMEDCFGNALSSSISLTATSLRQE
ncbi:hypothetical protein ALC62_00991 [Cyphomyrmex costatus]|uniref:Uncharacterized protein n=1 Tax=Cyphomyrmex costatus TaxID=456900 RepID=A0A195D5L8_9HYME|nr:hypothetical protein ALC62_00991 [Cyphomyrmex costatus]